MFNCLVIGSGRSGTSMVAGTLSGAGYFMGNRLLSPTSINPKGYFESKDIEQINEQLLSQVVPARPRGMLGNFFRHRPTRNQRWLARVPVGKQIICPDEIAIKIKDIVQKEPFCFKDPRFCYTLPAWKPFIDNTVYLCIFRHPSATASSIMKVRAKHKYLHDLALDFQQALEVWRLMYQHILQIHRHEGQWLFMHYNQVLTNEGLDRIEEFVDGKIDRSFPDLSLRNALPDDRGVNSQVREVYEELCRIAEYQEL